MCNRVIIDVKIVTDNKTVKGCSIHIEGGYIKKIYREEPPQKLIDSGIEIIDGKGRYILPGVIDDQVHFREPGLEYKAEIATESKAAVAGGVTSFMEMPNTTPQTTTIEALETKFKRASEVSMANYSFYLGATNSNIEEIKKIDPTRVCGVKVFMGSSTGNMLVDNDETLAQIFKESPVLVATHCEDEETIQNNMAAAREKYGEDVPMEEHPNIRSAEACFKSSEKAVNLAKKHNARLHVLHLTTAKEMGLFEIKPLEEKRITGEVCVHHLWFDESDYKEFGAKIKWNPAVKSKSDRDALRVALKEGRIDVVATDHAPHTKEEKTGTYFKAPSGGPLVQHSLVTMLEMMHQGVFTIEQIVDKMCHAPAKLYGVDKRGYIKKGYKADLVLIERAKWKVTPETIHCKCGWSPFDDQEFSYRVTDTFISGERVYSNSNGEEKFDNEFRGEALTFTR